MVTQGCMALRQDLGKSAAVWILIRPGSLERYEEALASVEFQAKCPQGLDPRSGKPDEQRLAADELARIMGSVHCVQYYQQPGQMVTVPAGWPHLVVNLRDNIKIAVDVSQPAGLPPSLAA